MDWERAEMKSNWMHNSELESRYDSVSQPAPRLSISQSQSLKMVLLALFHSNYHGTRARREESGRKSEYPKRQQNHRNPGRQAEIQVEEIGVMTRRTLRDSAPCSALAKVADSGILKADVFSLVIISVGGRIALSKRL